MTKFQWPWINILLTHFCMYMLQNYVDNAEVLYITYYKHTHARNVTEPRW